MSLLGLLCGLHLVLFFSFDSASYHPSSSSAQSPESLITVFVRPRIREPGEPVSVIDPSTLRLRVDPRLFAFQLAQDGVDFSVERNGAATVVAPTLEGDGHSGMQPYLQQAGLSRGEGATVVLRIEVLASGDPGRIEVDASSGSRQIDAAAVSFARIQHWYAGRVNGTARAMWIRWGVRLQT